MKWIIAIILLAVPVLAGNEVILTDTTGGAQTNRPIMISRVFTKAEFPSGSYPRPSVSGTPLTQWQTNIRNTWPDGSAKHVLIAFTQTIGSSASVTVSFVSDSNPCYLGNQATCDAAAPANATAVRNFASANWDASIETTQASATQQTRLSTMITAGSYRFWVKGPLCNVIVVEDRTTSLAYDYGYTWNSGSSTWSVASTSSQKSLHPYFVITQHTGWSGVKIEYITEATWATKLQSQVYNLALKKGASLGTTWYTKSTYTHGIASRWRKVTWDGSQPGAIKIDFNFAYMIASKMLPNFDTSHVVGPSAVTLETNWYNGTDKCDLGGNGIFNKIMGDYGGRPEIGYLDRWSVRWLYTMSPALYDVMLGYAECSGLISQTHLRESTTGRWFDSGHTTDAFGHVVSINARPQGTAYGGLDSNYSQLSDILTVVGPRDTDGWQPELAHTPNFTFLPYLVTGDMYWLEEMWFWSSWGMFLSQYDVTSRDSRHEDWGYFYTAIAETRGQAWSLRTAAHSSWMALDTDPEKAYFKEKVENNIAIAEGRFQITTGNYYDTSPTSKWSWGKNLHFSTPNPLHFFLRTQNNPSNDVDITKACSADSPWAANFNHVIFGLIEELEVTDKIHPLRVAVASNTLGQILDSGYTNHYMAGAYKFSVTDMYGGVCVGQETAAPYGGVWNGPYFTTWANVYGAFKSADTATAVTDWAGRANDPEHGYPNILRAAVSFMKDITSDGYSGLDAWNWVYPKADAAALGNNVTSCGGSPTDPTGPVSNCDNPRWALLPRAAVVTSGSSVGKRISGKVATGGRIVF